MKAIICSFESGLDDIPPKQRNNDDYVLEVLRKNPCFTCFSASEHQTLALTLDRLKQTGRIEYPNPQPGYPWNKVRVIEMVTEAKRGLPCPKCNCKGE